MMCKIILQQQIMTFSTDTRTGTLTKPKTETITKQKYPKRHNYTVFLFPFSKDYVKKG